MTRGERGSRQVMPQSGKWLTVFSASGEGVLSEGEAVACGTNDYGALTGTRDAMVKEGGSTDAWLDFIVDEDMFIVHKGLSTEDKKGTISELSMTLSGVELPGFYIDTYFDQFEKRYKQN